LLIVSVFISELLDQLTLLPAREVHLDEHDYSGSEIIPDGKGASF